MHLFAKFITTCNFLSVDICELLCCHQLGQALRGVFFMHSLFLKALSFFPSDIHAGKIFISVDLI